MKSAWEYNGKTEVYVQTDQGRTVVKVPEEVGRLIAEAPALLEALEWAVGTDMLPHGKDLDNALLAILAAKGMLDHD